INASNPCVTGDTLVATSEGWRRIEELVGKTARVLGLDGAPHVVTRIFPTGSKPVHRLRTKAGYEVRLTADHKVFTLDRGAGAVNEEKALRRAVGIAGNPGPVHVSVRGTGSRLSFSSGPVVDLFKQFAVLDQGSEEKRFTSAVHDLDRPSMASVLRGLFTAD